MNPWSIIGWAIVLIGGAFAAFVVIQTIRLSFIAWRDHRRTRNIPPEAGQVWLQGAVNGAGYVVKRIAENGRIVLSTGSASWSDSPDEWRTRVREQRLRLVRS